LFLFLECVHLLLAHNATVRVKNGLGWNPISEAVSYGDRQTSKFAEYSVLKNGYFFLYNHYSLMCIMYACFFMVFLV